jgi:hypothetical protein
MNTLDYENALAGDGPLAARWADNPERLTHELCGEVEGLQTALREVADYAAGKLGEDAPPIATFPLDLPIENTDRAKALVMLCQEIRRLQHALRTVAGSALNWITKIHIRQL